MTIGVLLFTRIASFETYAYQRLTEVAEAKGHSMHILYKNDFTFHHTKDQIEILYEGKPFEKTDVLIARQNFSEEPSLHTHATDILERSGIPVLNGHARFSLAKNKIAQRLVLAEAGVAMPRWAIAHEAHQVREAAETIGYPIIAKVPFGTWGRGVFYAENPETLAPIADYVMKRDKIPLILEQFIEEAGRKDLRIYIVSGKIVGAMERHAREGEVRANASIGGVGAPVELSEEEKHTALRAVEAFGLEIAGVDMLRSNKGPLIIEINANPGFEELERATGADVAGAIIDAAVEKAKRGV